MDTNEFGQDIARLRERVGMSLRQLSRKAHMSPASLSAIEKGQSSPMLATLHKILKALGTDFADFFSSANASEKLPVFPASKMRSIKDRHRRYTLLFPKRDDLKFEMVSERIAPSETEPEWETHDFDIGGVVLDGGPLRLEIEGLGEWELTADNAYYIKAGQTHRATNLGDKPVEQITVAHPPRY